MPDASVDRKIRPGQHAPAAPIGRSRSWATVVPRRHAHRASPRRLTDRSACRYGCGAPLRAVTRAPDPDDAKGWAMQAFPSPQGLYDGLHEHDACGVAFVATLTGEASHDIVAKAITALRNLEHRGAVGAEPDSGDGAGILMQVPDRFLRAVGRLRAARAQRLRRRHRLHPRQRRRGRRRPASDIEELAAEEGLRSSGWRDVPTDPELLGGTARSRDADLSASCSSPRRAASWAWRWSAWPSACASAPSTRPASTSPRCRRAPWPTRAC